MYLDRLTKKEEALGKASEIAATLGPFIRHLLMQVIRSSASNIGEGYITADGFESRDRSDPALEIISDGILDYSEEDIKYILQGLKLLVIYGSKIMRQTDPFQVFAQVFDIPTDHPYVQELKTKYDSIPVYNGPDESYKSDFGAFKAWNNDELLGIDVSVDFDEQLRQLGFAFEKARKRIESGISSKRAVLGSEIKAKLPNKNYGGYLNGDLTTTEKANVVTINKEDVSGKVLSTYVIGRGDPEQIKELLTSNSIKTLAIPENAIIELGFIWIDGKGQICHTTVSEPLNDQVRSIMNVMKSRPLLDDIKKKITADMTNKGDVIESILQKLPDLGKKIIDGENIGSAILSFADDQISNLPVIGPLYSAGKSIVQGFLSLFGIGKENEVRKPVYWSENHENGHKIIVTETNSFDNITTIYTEKDEEYYGKVDGSIKSDYRDGFTALSSDSSKPYVNYCYKALHRSTGEIVAQSCYKLAGLGYSIDVAFLPAIYTSVFMVNRFIGDYYLMFNPQDQVVAITDRFTGEILRVTSDKQLLDNLSWLSLYISDYDDPKAANHKIAWGISNSVASKANGNILYNNVKASIIRILAEDLPITEPSHHLIDFLWKRSLDTTGEYKAGMVIPLPKDVWLFFDYINGHIIISHRPYSNNPTTVILNMTYLDDFFSVDWTTRAESCIIPFSVLIMMVSRYQSNDKGIKDKIDAMSFVSKSDILAYVFALLSSCGLKYYKITEVISQRSTVSGNLSSQDTQASYNNSPIKDSTNTPNNVDNAQKSEYGSSETNDNIATVYMNNSNYGSTVITVGDDEEELVEEVIKGTAPDGIYRIRTSMIKSLNS